MDTNKVSSRPPGQDQRLTTVTRWTSTRVVTEDGGVDKKGSTLQIWTQEGNSGVSIRFWFTLFEPEPLSSSNVVSFPPPPCCPVTYPECHRARVCGRGGPEERDEGGGRGTTGPSRKAVRDVGGRRPGRDGSVRRNACLGVTDPGFHGSILFCGETPKNTYPHRSPVSRPVTLHSS